MGNQETTTIKGFIRSLPHVSALEAGAKVAVVTEDGTEYLVIHKGVGIDLLEHTSANAEVTGVVTAKEDGYIIQVRSYSVNDGYDDAWYDDTDD